jgi:hypothetical protein
MKTSAVTLATLFLAQPLLPAYAKPVGPFPPKMARIHANGINRAYPDIDMWKGYTIACRNPQITLCGDASTDAGRLDAARGWQSYRKFCSARVAFQRAPKRTGPV